VRILRFSALDAAALGAVVCLGLGTTGCGQHDFNPGGIVGYAPIHLDAEQVMLSGDQVDCGVKSDLWEAPPATLAGGRASAKLLEAGRNLHFDDDVVYAEAGVNQPYVQVRGDFSVQLADDASIRDDGPDGKLVEGRLTVTIPHACFPAPLAMLGVRKGKFVEDAPPILKFSTDGQNWRFIKIIH
jgi:hypothetical protein